MPSLIHSPVSRPDSGSPSRIGRRQLVRRDTYRPPPEADYWVRVYRHAMACRFEVTLGGEDAACIEAARQALDRVDAIEERLSIFRETSTLAMINRSAAHVPVAVDDDLLALLRLCRRLHRDTGGAFDVTATPLSKCWGFLRRQGRLPDAAEITAARACVGMDLVAIDDDRRTVAFTRNGVALNLGAIGKGWALDRLVDGLRRDGVAHALLSAGHSSVLAIGSRGKGWPIALTSPRLTRPIARVHLRDGALGTSGAGEQFFEIDGHRFGHVIDPRTGWPATGVLSASVITADAANADALSTAFLVGGIDLARRYCASHPRVLAVMTGDDGCTEVVGAFPGADVEVS
jgi:thiamine biosynthesis lipoprotein